jgi:glycosidase
MEHSLINQSINLRLSYGDFVDISSGDEHVFAYTRTSGDESGCESESALVVLKIGEEEAEWEGAFRFVLGNYSYAVLERVIVCG